MHVKQEREPYFPSAGSSDDEKAIVRSSMTTWIALFRGINVGGNNMLPMATLRSDLETLELKNVRTYIQSGNVLFDSTARSASALTKKIGGLIEKKYGFRPWTCPPGRD